MITDEQIHGLWDGLLAADIRSIQGPEVRECRIALRLIAATPMRERLARRRCAEMLRAADEADALSRSTGGGK